MRKILSAVSILAGVGAPIGFAASAGAAPAAKGPSMSLSSSSSETANASPIIAPTTIYAGDPTSILSINGSGFPHSDLDAIQIVYGSNNAYGGWIWVNPTTSDFFASWQATDCSYTGPATVEGLYKGKVIATASFTIAPGATCTS